MKYYKINTWSKNIQEVEVSRETESSIFIIASSGKEQRSAKYSNYVTYFATKEEAISALNNRYSFDLITAEKNVEKAKEEYQIFKYKYQLP